MIERAQSFSKGGKNIERIMQIQKYKIDQEKLTKILSSRDNKLALYKQHIKTPIHIQGFNKIPGREKPNSFLLHNIKDTNTAIDYDNKKETVLPKAVDITVNRETDKRLSHLFTKTQYTSKEEGDCCKRHSQTNNQHIRTANDLQSGRRTFHSLNFQKQSSRPFEENLRKMSIEVEKQLVLTRANSLRGFSERQPSNKNTTLKLNKAHSFQSYTKRDFLSEKKIKCAPEVSGIDSFKINPQKFKSNWKTINAPKFEQVAKKHLNRYDRDCDHWYTKLSYNVKNTKNSDKNALDFNNQTDRKSNLVKSGYPIRLAI